MSCNGKCKCSKEVFSPAELRREKNAGRVVQTKTAVEKDPVREASINDAIASVPANVRLTLLARYFNMAEAMREYVKERDRLSRETAVIPEGHRLPDIGCSSCMFSCINDGAGPGGCLLDRWAEGASHDASSQVCLGIFDPERGERLWERTSTGFEYRLYQHDGSTVRVS